LRVVVVDSFSLAALGPRGVKDEAAEHAGVVMSTLTVKNERRDRRKSRIRGKVYGTPERPRLTVFRSLKNIYVQLIDDVSGTTLVEASSRAKDLRESVGYGGNKAAAVKVGKALGEKAIAKGIKQVAFDRNAYKYHGRIKALADAAREAGLKF
jgi:large subunit ribosomal protein L18